MEKISLLLLLVKKTLIGSVITGVLSAGGFSFFGSPTNKDEKNTKIEKKVSTPYDCRPRLPRG